MFLGEIMKFGQEIDEYFFQLMGDMLLLWEVVTGARSF